VALLTTAQHSNDNSKNNLKTWRSNNQPVVTEALGHRRQQCHEGDGDGNSKVK